MTDGTYIYDLYNRLIVAEMSCSKEHLAERKANAILIVQGVNAYHSTQIAIANAYNWLVDANRPVDILNAKNELLRATSNIIDVPAEYFKMCAGQYSESVSQKKIINFMSSHLQDGRSYDLKKAV